MPTHPPPLEVQVFGPDPPPDERDGDESGGPPGGRARRCAGPEAPTPLDLVTRCMVPVVACLLVVVVVLWSLSKTVQYNELFANSPRYTYGLWSLNVGVIVLSMGVLWYHVGRASV